MPKIIDMTNRVFGLLTVLSRVPATGQAKWLCACSCGNKTIQPGYDLRKGLINSCGCAKKERLAKLSTTHGMTNSKEYRAWINMRNRCFRTKGKDFQRYGAKGVTVCDEWKTNFERFFSDMGNCPDGFSLDRIDSMGNYEPTNCRWANIYTQANNKKRVEFITLEGETLPLSEWCRKLGLSHRAIRARIYERGWYAHAALTTPIRKIKGHR